MIPRAAVVAEARSWIGTRWHHQASLKGVGTDCIGLVGGVALALGVPGAAAWRDTPAFHNYGRKPDPKVLLAGCDTLMDRVTDMREGDVLVLRFDSGPQHFAFLTSVEPPAIVHALAQARRVTEARLDRAWRERIVRVYRLRGVE
jgi:NlpC/P60 family putative phage cell wall peptidase